MSVLPVYAQPLHIGIQLSRSCQLSENCPTYPEIAALFPDTSDTRISGGFDGNGFRTGKALNNHFEFYKYHEDNVMWIDPPGDITNRIKMITIEPSLPEYLTAESYAMPNHSIITGHDRSVSKGCSKSTISAENWILLTGDTIRLMQHNCDYSYSNYNHWKVTYFAKSVQDITTSYKYKLDSWIADTKQRCRELCFEY